MKSYQLLGLEAAVCRFAFIIASVILLKSGLHCLLLPTRAPIATIWRASA